MDELVNKLSETLGLPQGEARKAALITVGYLRSRLNPALADEITLLLDLEHLDDEETRFLGTFQVP